VRNRILILATLGFGMAGFHAEAPAQPTREQVMAQQRACEARKAPRRAQGTISESTYRRLERIIDAIAKGEYADSEKRLKELMSSARGGYEKAIILQTLGFVYASQNQNLQAIQTFEEALSQNALPQQPHEQMMFNIAQLYVADEKREQGIKALQAYMQESCNPLPDAHILLASVYAERKQFRQSLEQTDLALLKAREPKESWLQLKLALHYELKEFPKCAEVLIDLVALVPTKEDYWKQLSGILFEIKRDPQALAVLALAESRGYVSRETEYRNLANLYMYLQIPYKAAQVLQSGIDKERVAPTERNLELAANAWLLAREYDRAEKAMRRAAEVSDEGELWKRLGQIYIEKESWKQALDALTRAERKGGTKEPGELAFLIGVAAVELRDWERANKALRKAMEFEKTRKVATEWLAHLQQEQLFHEPPPEPVVPGLEY
jgi:tetratricopeptide (TPR) repeat protein